jgi:hypothetical protein
MLALLIFVAVLFLVDSLTSSQKAEQIGGLRPTRLIRHISENEVIAEFLKTDFNNPAFRSYQDALHETVVRPDLEDPVENEKRRALLFIRHRALWNELPAETEWYQFEVKEEDLSQIRVFPRAQWRKVAQGDFSITTVAECMRRRRNSLDAGFLTKIDEIRNRLLRDDVTLGPVLLIGTSENEPLTVLDGNHRLMAAMLATPSKVHRLRFLAGLTPRMTECCWYNTNLTTLFRYGRNTLKDVVRRPKVELARFLQSPSELRTTVENRS